MTKVSDLLLQGAETQYKAKENRRLTPLTLSHYFHIAIVALDILSSEARKLRV